jgi:hypothetical protein
MVELIDFFGGDVFPNLFSVQRVLTYPTQPAGFTFF